MNAKDYNTLHKISTAAKLIAEAIEESKSSNKNVLSLLKGLVEKSQRDEKEKLINSLTFSKTDKAII